MTGSFRVRNAKHCWRRSAGESDEKPKVQLANRPSEQIGERRSNLFKYSAEIATVVVIAGILLGLTFPAMNAARESARVASSPSSPADEVREYLDEASDSIDLGQAGEGYEGVWFSAETEAPSSTIEMSDEMSDGMSDGAITMPAAQEAGTREANKKGLIEASPSPAPKADPAETPLPSPYYLQDDVQYFPSGPEFKLPREEAELRKVRELEKRNWTAPAATNGLAIPHVVAGDVDFDVNAKDESVKAAEPQDFALGVSDFATLKEELGQRVVTGLGDSESDDDELVSNAPQQGMAGKSIRFEGRSNRPQSIQRERSKLLEDSLADADVKKSDRQDAGRLFYGGSVMSEGGGMGGGGMGGGVGGGSNGRGLAEPAKVPAKERATEGSMESWSGEIAQGEFNAWSDLSMRRPSSQSAAGDANGSEGTDKSISFFESSQHGNESKTQSTPVPPTPNIPGVLNDRQVIEKQKTQMQNGGWRYAPADQTIRGKEDLDAADADSGVERSLGEIAALSELHVQLDAGGKLPSVRYRDEFDRDGDGLAATMETAPDFIASGAISRSVAGADRREMDGEDFLFDESESIRLSPSKKLAVASGLNEVDAKQEAFSTFSLHVSDVSFKLAYDALSRGEWPESEKIRIEEFVNAFDYGDPMPSQSEKVACRLEQSIHPFLQQRNLLRIAMRTAAAGRANSTPLRLTLLLDNSGSMERVDRRQTVRRAFALLAQQLQPFDQVTLISFARQPRLLADKVSGAQSGELVQRIANLPSEGGTNLEAALQLAFEKAREQKVDGAQNRIILLTDGAANLGDAHPESLSRMITTMRGEGIAFDAAGISADGLNDEILEALTRKGDGRYYLLDSLEAADDGFARQIAGALRPAAKNVKVQIEFNPNRVGRYKLLGFEKHRLKQEDFRNDKVDAAEMAAAEAGVAMYQFEAKPDGEGDVGMVWVRFRDLSTGKMIENCWPIPYEAEAVRCEQAAPSMRLATAAALLAAKLRGEPLGESVDLKTLSNLVAGLPAQDRSVGRVQQIQQMIERARQVSGE